MKFLGNRNIKRMIAVFLLTVTAVSSGLFLTRCASEADKAEVLAAFKELYEKSIEINDYIFGEGLPVTESFDSDDVKSPYYVAVSENAEYRTREELEAAVLEVYSSEYYESALKAALFEGYADGSGPDPRYITDGSVFKTDAGNKGADTSGRFDPETAEIVDISASSASVRATYTRAGTVAEYTLSMVRTENGWRFNVPTY